MRASLQSKLIFSFFAILIITILVYKVFDQDYFKKTTVHRQRRFRPPKMDGGIFSHLDEMPATLPVEEPVVESSPPPPPPPLSVDKPDPRSKWLDDTVTTFLPNDTPQTSLPFFELNGGKSNMDETTENDQEDGSGEEDQEVIIEGFTALSDFFQFLGFLLEVVIAMICIAGTIVVHIVYALIGAFYIIEAFFFFVIGFIENLFKTFSDFNQVMNDISRCGMTWNQNLQYCAVWYILDVIGYLAIMIFVWLPTAIVRILTLGKVDLNNLFISVIGVKGSGYRDTNGNVINRDGILAIISKKFKPIIGFDPLHFPPKVMEKCYSCNIIQDFFQVIYDLTIGFMNILQTPMEKVGQAIPWYWKAYYIDAFLGKGSFCSV
jgi:hypothetical protein